MNQVGLRLGRFRNQLARPVRRKFKVSKICSLSFCGLSRHLYLLLGSVDSTDEYSFLYGYWQIHTMYYVFMENTQIIKHQIIVLPTRVLYEKRYLI